MSDELSREPKTGGFTEFWQQHYPRWASKAEINIPAAVDAARDQDAASHPQSHVSDAALPQSLQTPRWGPQAEPRTSNDNLATQFFQSPSTAQQRQPGVPDRAAGPPQADGWNWNTFGPRVEESKRQSAGQPEQTKWKSDVSLGLLLRLLAGLALWLHLEAALLLLLARFVRS